MSLNALMRWLKPREMVFFDLLESAAGNAYQASQLFDLEIRTGDPVRFAELRRQMKDLEHIGDDITREIMDRLNHTFVTPIEREDIMELAHALDDVVDKIHAVCERLILYRIGHVMPAVTEMSSIIVEGSGEILHLIRSLRNMSNQKMIRDRIQRVHILENKADSIYHAGLAQIFEDPKDPIELIKWKELLEQIEDATDKIELVAKVIGSTVMKNA
ncbi:MAG: phosphate transport regulator [Holophagaceae bacterium]|nr:phosphate transport regulator [Holophagaceae bacterium]